MSGTEFLAVVGGLVALAAGLYGLHRLALWLEARGHLYYRNKKPGDSPARCLSALQEALDPPVRHVIQIKDEKRRNQGEGGTE